MIFYFDNEKLIVRIHIKNHAKYPEELKRLPESVAHEIDKANDCVKFVDSEKCWKGCIGYDFYIRKKRYQKCYTNCFQLEVDSQTMPFLLEVS